MKGYALYILSDYANALSYLLGALTMVENTGQDVVESRIAGGMPLVHDKGA